MFKLSLLVLALSIGLNPLPSLASTADTNALIGGVVGGIIGALLVDNQGHSYYVDNNHHRHYVSHEQAQQWHNQHDSNHRNNGRHR